MTTCGTFLRAPVVALLIAGTCFSALPVSAATLLSASVNIGQLNSDLIQDAETSSDATVASFVDASGSGTSFQFGNPIAPHSASASIDYQSGALRARAESTAVGSSAVGGSAAAVARFFDEITFTVSASAASRDVTFIWQVDRIIEGDGRVFGFFQVRDAVSSFGNTLINDQFNGLRTFRTSGEYQNTATITLPAFPSSTNPVLRVEYLLNAQAPILPSSGPKSLADAGNTAYFDIIVPEGITFQGGGAGFLSTAPDLSAPAPDPNLTPIPVPAGLPLLAGGLALLAMMRRRA